MLLADILKSDPDFLRKLDKYKTAWSPTYKAFVGIVHVHYDDLGQPIISARVAGGNDVCLFRVEELSNFVL